MRGAPTKAEAEALGLTLEEATSVCMLWPDNLTAVNLFIDLFTQWRVGMNGPTGLDYSAALSVMDIRAIPKEDRAHLFADLRILEDEALRVIRAKAKNG